MKVAIAKAIVKETAQLYGDMIGVTTYVEITPEQKWKVRTAAGYIWLSRKGGMVLRLTPNAFQRLFILREE